MSIGLIVLHVVLMSIAFFVSMNSYLRGAAKARLDGFLSIALIVALALLWWSSGWKAAAVAVPMVFVYGALLTPLAKRSAWRLLGYRTSAETGREHADLRSLESGQIGLDDYFEMATKRREREEGELAALLRRPSVQDTLANINSSPEEVADLVRVLSLTGVGRELSLAAVTDPESLPELIAMRREGSTAIELAGTVMRL